MVILVLLPGLAACTTGNVGKGPTIDRAMTTPLTFLALGDSYTIGEGVPPAQRWPSQLIERLRSRGIAVEEPTIVARTGWSTDELESAIDQQNLRGTWDLVTLMIGVNDQYRGRSSDEYREGFKRLLDRAIRFTGGDTSRVIVLSIPDWGVTPFAVEKGRDPATIAREINDFNDLAARESASRGVMFVDVTAISRRAAQEPALLAPDGLHPSGAMYSEWVDTLEPIVASKVNHR